MPLFDLHTLYHIAVSFGITAGYVSLRPEPTWQDYVFIGGAVMGAGFAKECYDQSVGGLFDPWDMVANGAGVGLAVGLTWRLK